MALFRPSECLDLSAHGSLSLVTPMRSKLFALCALCLTSAWSLDAAAAPPAKKRPPAPVAAPAARKTPPTVPVATPGEQPAAGDQAGAAATRGPTRIDFDDRLIQGQTNKSGAVYLYDRKELKIRSMIKKRENFRDEIIGSLYDS
jgi:hypothetical protein